MFCDNFVCPSFDCITAICYVKHKLWGDVKLSMDRYCKVHKIKESEKYILLFIPPTCVFTRSPLSWRTLSWITWNLNWLAENISYSQLLGTDSVVSTTLKWGKFAIHICSAKSTNCILQKNYKWNP